MNLHFISGLPRSGSTLLAGLINQNANCHASMSSPLAKVYGAVHASLGVDNEAVDFISESQRIAILRGLFEKYYQFWQYREDHGKGENLQICIDTSREWTARHRELFELFPQSKMIVLVRSVSEILNSFERVYRKNVLTSGQIWKTGSNVYSRSNDMLETAGVVQRPYMNAKDVFATGDASRVLFVRYDTLIYGGQPIIEQIFSFIGIKWRGDTKLAQIPKASEFDKRLGVEGLHTLNTETLAKENYGLLLPEDLVQKVTLSHPSFWEVGQAQSHILVV